MNWAELSPEERNKFVADTLMNGKLAPYSQDFNAAWLVVQEICRERHGPVTIGEDIGARKPSGFTLTVAGDGQRCYASFGNLLKVGAATPAQAICIAALVAEDVTVEGGQESWLYDKQIGSSTRILDSLEF